MNIPTKEELEKERWQCGLAEECKDFRFGGEAEGIMEFAQSIVRVGKITKSDETFIEYLIWGEYPYTLDGLSFWWENNVMRDGEVMIYENGEAKYYDKYTESQINSMALAWFDRKLGKMIRIGALNCSLNTGYMNSLKQGFTIKNFVEMIRQKVLTEISESKPNNP